MEVRRYLTASGDDPVSRWLKRLEDSKGHAGILRRIDRLSRGNFGDCKPCDAGVWELRIDFGPGYRLYYAKQQESIVLLLCAGTKSTQARDIELAVARWREFKVRRASELQ
jgi:putative addiction module killer protein